MSDDIIHAMARCGRLERELSIAGTRIKALEARLQVIYHALVAHAGDIDAHPCFHNDCLKMLRELGMPKRSKV